MPRATTLLRVVLLEPVGARSRRELAFLVLAAPLSWIAVPVLAFGALSAGILLVTLVGLPVLALIPLVARWFGEGNRRLATGLLDIEAPSPPPFTPAPGFTGWVRSALRYRDGWRALAYQILAFPVASVGLWIAAVGLAEGLIMLTYPLWWSVSGVSQTDAHGADRHSGMQVGSLYFDNWPLAFAVALAGLVVLLITPWVLRGVCLILSLLVRTFLSETSLTDRVRSLERSRAMVVDDAAATLRRVERDLHDGAQARLVSLAMQLGDARERLATGPAPDGVRELVGSAHDNAKEAIVELRDVVRGIHPPVLDSGLGPALETLTSRSPVPVDLDVRLDPGDGARPGVAVESIAYFCVAELLTNISRHSGAGRAGVHVVQREEQLELQVSDDGVGGAQAYAGSGLEGLAGRLGTVDGRMMIQSPPGGPTVVHVLLPIRS